MSDVFVAKNNKKDLKKTQAASRKKTSTKKKSKKPINPKTHKQRKALLGHTHNSLSAFNYYPDRVEFINKDPEEKVILLLRSHPITHVSWLLIVGLMLIIPNFFPVFDFFGLMPARFQIIIMLIWYLATFTYALERFLKWYFNVNIITDERIIEVDFPYLIYREITDANIDQIQDVTVIVGSALRTVFNYGNIIIQTAGEIPMIDFHAVPQPDRVAKILRELRVEEEQEKIEGRVR